MWGLQRCIPSSGAAWSAPWAARPAFAVTTRSRGVQGCDDCVAPSLLLLFSSSQLLCQIYFTRLAASDAQCWCRAARHILSYPRDFSTPPWPICISNNRRRPSNGQLDTATGLAGTSRVGLATLLSASVVLVASGDISRVGIHLSFRSRSRARRSRSGGRERSLTARVALERVAFATT